MLCFIFLPCRLREESTREAERVGEIARDLGAEHLTVALEWDGVKEKKTETYARNKRYRVLLQECTRLGVDVVMMGHHANDQIGRYGRRVGTLGREPHLCSLLLSLRRDHALSDDQGQWRRWTGRHVPEESLGDSSTNQHCQAPTEML